MKTACTRKMNSIENNKGIIVCSVCANDSLSIKSNHNSHINKRFDYLVNRSNDFVNRPNDLFNRPNDLVNRFTLVTKHYVEKLGKQFKDLLKCVDIKDIYLSNYELRFIKT